MRAAEDPVALFEGLPTLEGYVEYKPEIANTPEVGLRREWRIVANTGELRGVCWRERTANRKAVKYVGKRSNPEEFERYVAVYEEWRRTNRTLAAVGLVTNRNPDRTR